MKSGVLFLLGLWGWAALLAQSIPTAWGRNDFGTVGDGTFQSRSSPVAVATNGVLSGLRIVALAAGGSHSVAVANDGRAFLWGRSLIGSTADGTFLYYSSPIVVESSGVLAGRRLVQVAAGQDFSLAVDATGQVFGWGVNGLGQLGDGTSTDRRAPVAVDRSGVLSGKSIAGIAAGGYHALAVTSDGQVAGWGNDGFGELGDGVNLAQRLSPVWVATNGVLSGQKIIAVAAGQFHSLALSASGQVFAWGYNQYGQLGNGGTLNETTPVAVDTSGVLSNQTVVAISAGSFHSLALTAQGQVFAWGDNTYGQLGDGDTTERHSPVAVSQQGVLKGARIVAIACGGAHNLVATESGALMSWGGNLFGRLGDGTTLQRNEPVAVDNSGLLKGRVVTVIGTGPMALHSLAVALPAPPRMGIDRQASNLWLSVNGLPHTTYRVDSAVDLKSTGAWVALTNVVTDASGSRSNVTVSPRGTTFWRGVATP